MKSNIIEEHNSIIAAQARLFICANIAVELTTLGRNNILENTSLVFKNAEEFCDAAYVRQDRFYSWQRRRQDLQAQASRQLAMRLRLFDNAGRPYNPDSLGHAYRMDSRYIKLRRPFAALGQVVRDTINAGNTGNRVGQREGKQRLLCMAFDTNYISLVFQIMEKHWPALRTAVSVARQRFNTGHWTEPVWADCGWSDRHPSHFVHASRETPGNVAFYPDAEKLEADKLTSMKPGRYLTQFYGDVLTAEQIKQWANKQWAITRPVELKFVGNDDPLGWVWVYENSQSSCMRYNRSNRYINTNLMGDKHPVTVYAHPENSLALAYMMLPGEVEDRMLNCDTDEYVVGARTIVNTRDKTYLRIYGASEVQHAAMKEALERAGYAQSDSTLRRETLRLVEVEDGGYLCPYLDGAYACVSAYSSHLLIGDDGVCAHVTCGYVTNARTCCCGHCGEHCDEEAGAYVDSIDAWVCDDCTNRDFVRAIGRFGDSEIYRETDNGIVYCECNGSYYVTEYLSSNYMGMTEDGEVYPEDQLVYTEDGVYYVGDVVELTYEFNDYQWALRDRVYHLPNGETCHVDDADKIAEIEALEQEAA